MLDILQKIARDKMTATQPSAWERDGRRIYELDARKAYPNASQEDLDEAWKQAKKSDKPSAISLDDFLALDFPDPKWLANKMIPQGALVAFSGKPGSYKTFFAIWIAKRIAAGLPIFEEMDEEFFCKQTVIQTPILFIEEEQSQPLTFSRLKSLRKTPGVDFHLRIDQGFKMQDETWRKALLADVAHKGIGLIIMDPFSSVMGLENENDNAEVSQVMDLIRKEFISKGITVIFIHHPSKGDTDGKNLRGAGDILGKCDVHLHFEKDETDKRQITVSYEKMRLVPDDEVENFKMRITGDALLHDQHFRYLGPAKPKGEEEREELAEAIKKNMAGGELYGKKVLAESVGQKLNNKKFIGAWEFLEKNGHITASFEKKHGNAQFRLT